MVWVLVAGGGYYLSFTARKENRWSLEGVISGVGRALIGIVVGIWEGWILRAQGGECLVEQLRGKQVAIALQSVADGGGRVWL